jgi:hypothetical protein
MVFVNYVMLIVLASSIVLMAASIWAFRFVKGRRPRLRIPIRCVATFAVAFCSLTTGLFTISDLTTISSSATYSPDRQHALRVDYADSGALGGVTFVELYWNHGLCSSVIFSQEGRTVRAENLRWISNSEVLVPYSVYSPDRRPQVCRGSSQVKVGCVEIPAIKR